MPVSGPKASKLYAAKLTAVAVPKKVTIPEAVTPSGGEMMATSGGQLPIEAGGVGVNAASSVVLASSTGVSMSLKTPSLSGPLRVTVGAIARVGVARLEEPSGVGDTRGVAKMFGVGVGGLRSPGGKVGATSKFT